MKLINIICHKDTSAKNIVKLDIKVRLNRSNASYRFWFQLDKVLSHGLSAEIERVIRIGDYRGNKLTVLEMVVEALKRKKEGLNE